MLAMRRRDFIKSAGLGAAGIALPGCLASGLDGAGPGASGYEQKGRATMKLSFMTFVCPEWGIEKVVEFAAETDYDGVEIRVDAGHKHEVSSRSTSEERARVRKLFEDKGVEVACVATSVKLAFSEADKLRENIDAAKANLDLGIAEAFDEIGEHAAPRGVCPMLECGHDIIKSAAEASEVIKRVKVANFGVLWNRSNMDEQTFEALKGRIRHFHIHKEVLDPENRNIAGLAKLMKSIDYRGYVSLEIIENRNLPEEQLIETGKRLKAQIAEAYAV
jgi:sugar phosphate isomerase/epimerase